MCTKAINASERLEFKWQRKQNEYLNLLDFIQRLGKFLSPFKQNQPKTHVDYSQLVDISANFLISHLVHGLWKCQLKTSYFIKFLESHTFSWLP